MRIFLLLSVVGDCVNFCCVAPIVKKIVGFSL